MRPHAGVQRLRYVFLELSISNIRASQAENRCPSLDVLWHGGIYQLPCALIWHPRFCLAPAKCATAARCSAVLSGISLAAAAETVARAPRHVTRRIGVTLLRFSSFGADAQYVAQAVMSLRRFSSASLRR